MRESGAAASVAKLGITKGLKVLDLGFAMGILPFQKQSSERGPGG